MAQNVTSWKWTRQKARAADLVADGRWTEEQMASKLGLSRRQLARYKATPEFQLRVEEILAVRDAEALRSAIARTAARVAAQNERWQALQQIRQERGQALAGQAPGAGTGDLVRTLKQVGSGATAQLVEEFTLDAALLRELRELEDLVARELGQHERKDDDSPAPIALAQVLITNREDAAAYMARLASAPAGTIGRAALPSPAAPPSSFKDALAVAEATEGGEQGYVGGDGI
jgi:hypothetical protein